jgi:hypothetical protein
MFVITEPNKIIANNSREPNVITALQQAQEPKVSSLSTLAGLLASQKRNNSYFQVSYNRIFSHGSEIAVIIMEAAGFVIRLG